MPERVGVVPLGGGQRWLSRRARVCNLAFLPFESGGSQALPFGVACGLDHRPESDDRASVIATTDDNRAHPSGLLITRDLADLVDYLPLGRGAVAIKAEDQSPRRSFPPLVLYPDGKVKPLLVTEPRTPDADSELLEINNLGFFYAIGEEAAKEQWAADVDAGEIYPLLGSPPGDLREHVPGRGGAILTLPGHRTADDGLWRFNTSTDHGHSWAQTEVRLPPGRKPTSQYAGPATHAVGPGHPRRSR